VISKIQQTTHSVVFTGFVQFQTKPLTGDHPNHHFNIMLHFGGNT
jgi:hypothetical protein